MISDMIVEQYNTEQYNSETVEELAATVAHEIKNPVALALANLYMIKTEDQDNRYSKYCGVIERELYKISELVTEFTELSAERHIEKSKKTELNKLLAEVINDFRSAGVIRIRFIPGAPIYSVCDPNKISIVFTNLIKNALEATDACGSVRIAVGKAGDSATITVMDNGSGFSPAAMSMTPGYTSKQGGSGLGLSICRNIITRHGGTLTLWNNDGPGASVLVTLPLS